MTNVHSPREAVLRTFDLIQPVVVVPKHRGVVFSNGVVCVVVHDPDCTLAAASVSVRVGSNQDPEDLPGLAHFCEHMLFMGTAKYPGVDEFDRYVTQHGGHTNAFTTSDTTTFYFTCVNHTMLDALDRFLEFFVAPNFDPSCVEKEVRAVHSEDEKNHSVDYWRIDELMRLLVEQRHPYHRYGNGNRTTLWDEPRRAGIDIRERLVQFYRQYYVASALSLVIFSPRPVDEVLEVVANQVARLSRAPMTTVNSGFVPLGADPETPGHLALQTGPSGNSRNVADRDARFHSLTLPLSRCAPFSPTSMRRWYGMVSKKKMRLLRLQFPYWNPRRYRAHKCAAYASHVLGHECDASILGVLKKRGWGTSLVASQAHSLDDDDSIFSIDVSLTREGLRNVHEVVTIIFAAIDTLRTRDASSEAVVAQMMSEDRLTFEMEELRRAESHCADLSGSLLSATTYETAWLEQYVTASEDFERCLSDCFEFTRRFLLPHNCVFFLIWDGYPHEHSADSTDGRPDTLPCDENDNDDDGDPPHTEEEEEEQEQAAAEPSAIEVILSDYESLPPYAQVTCNQQTRFHHLHYGSLSISEDVLAGWSSVRRHDVDGLNLPPLNPYLAKDFTVYPMVQPHEDEVCIREAFDFGTAHVRLSSDRFRIPKVALVCEIFSPAAYATPRARALTRVMCHVLSHALTEVSYLGELASIHNSVEPTPNGILISLDGASHKMADFFITILSRVCDAATLRGDAQQFSMYMDEVTRALESVAHQQPYSIASDRVNFFFVHRHYTFDQILADVRRADDGGDNADGSSSKPSTTANFYAEYVQHTAAFFSSVFLQFVACGNISSMDVIRTSYLQPMVSILQRHGCAAIRSDDPFLQRTPHRTVSWIRPKCREERCDGAARDHQKPLLPPTSTLTASPVLVQEFAAFSPQEVNSAAILTVAIGFETPRIRVLSDALVKVLSSSFFNALRTNETIGYTVAMRTSRLHALCAVEWVVQSARVDIDASYLLSRILAFLQFTAENWHTLVTDEAVASVVRSLTDVRMEPHKNLRSLAMETAVVTTHPSHGSWRRLELQELAEGAVSRESLSEFFFAFVANTSPSRSALATLIHAKRFDDTVARNRNRAQEVAPTAATTIGSSHMPTFPWTLPKKLPNEHDEETSGTVGGNGAVSGSSGGSSSAPRLPEFDGEHPVPPVVALWYMLDPQSVKEGLTRVRSDSARDDDPLRPVTWLDVADVETHVVPLQVSNPTSTM